MREDDQRDGNDRGLREGKDSWSWREGEWEKFRIDGSGRSRSGCSGMKVGRKKRGIRGGGGEVAAAAAGWLHAGNA